MRLMGHFSEQWFGFLFVSGLFLLVSHKQVFANQADHAELKIRFKFASVEQGQQILLQEDDFAKRLTAFDRKIRLKTTDDPGLAAILEFAANQVLPWTKQEKLVLNKAIDRLRSMLITFDFQPEQTVLLIKTSGKEESNAAYTRGNAIIFPKNKIGSLERPAVRLLAHELFHVLSRADPELRDRLYRLIGFKRVKQIQLPSDLEQKRITNPDAPRMEHVMEIMTEQGKTIVVTPFIFSKREFETTESNLFRYLNFQLLEVVENQDGVWVPVLAEDRPNLIDPSHPDYWRQIGKNTQYIIHPEEIIADNFALMMTGAEAEDKMLIASVKQEFQVSRKAD